MYPYLHKDDAPICYRCNNLLLDVRDNYCPYCNSPIDWPDYIKKQKENKKNVSK